MIQIRNILTEKQCQYVIDRHHENLYVSEIAKNYGVGRNTVYVTLKRAYKRLEAAGITPPRDCEKASPTQKGDFPVCVTVSPHTLAERTEG